MKSLQKYVYDLLVREGADLLRDGENIPPTEELFKEMIHDNDVYSEIGRANILSLQTYIKTIDKEKLLKDIEDKAAMPSSTNTKALKVIKAKDIFGTSL